MCCAYRDQQIHSSTDLHLTLARAEVSVMVSWDLHIPTSAKKFFYCFKRQYPHFRMGCLKSTVKSKERRKHLSWARWELDHGNMETLQGRALDAGSSSFIFWSAHLL